MSLASAVNLFCDARAEHFANVLDIPVDTLAPLHLRDLIAKEIEFGIGWGAKTITHHELAASFATLARGLHDKAKKRACKARATLLTSNIVNPALAEQLFFVLAETHGARGGSYMEDTAVALATLLFLDPPTKLVADTSATNAYFVVATAMLSVFANAFVQVTGEVSTCPYTAAWNAMAALFNSWAVLALSTSTARNVYAYVEYLMRQPICPITAMSKSANLARYVEIAFPSLYKRGKIDVSHPLYYVMTCGRDVGVLESPISETPLCYEELVCFLEASDINSVLCERDPSVKYTPFDNREPDDVDILFAAYMNEPVCGMLVSEMTPPPKPSRKRLLNSDNDSPVGKKSQRVRKPTHRVSY